MIITAQIQKIVFNVASTCAAESFRVKNKSMWFVAKSFYLAPKCSARPLLCTFHILVIVQNTKSLGTHVNLQFIDFLSLTNVNNIHYFYLACSIVSISDHGVTMKI
jgi:hypothetical protein